jgi:hypothetical protein
MILSISGKIGSGKDTTGKIMQILIDNPHFTNEAVKTFLDRKILTPSFTIEKWGGVLKDIVCLLTSCTRKELEDEEFKNKKLGEEWTTYAYAEGFTHSYSYKNGTETKTTVMNSVPCSKEKYEEELRINWQTAYKKVMTSRLLLQLLGTECGRNIIHPNIWVNALMSEYKMSYAQHKDIEYVKHKQYPNWIITDTRFPNEHKAVLNKGGINIKINRPKPECTCSVLTAENCTRTCDKSARLEHESETALDNATFDYTIENGGTLDELISKVRGILNTLKII